MPILLTPQCAGNRKSRQGTPCKWIFSGPHATSSKISLPPPRSLFPFHPGHGWSYSLNHCNSKELIIWKERLHKTSWPVCLWSLFLLLPVHQHTKWKDQLLKPATLMIVAFGPCWRIFFQQLACGDKSFRFRRLKDLYLLSFNTNIFRRWKSTGSVLRRHRWNPGMSFWHLKRSVASLTPPANFGEINYNIQ